MKSSRFFINSIFLTLGICLLSPSVNLYAMEVTELKENIYGEKEEFQNQVKSILATIDVDTGTKKNDIKAKDNFLKDIAKNCHAFFDKVIKVNFQNVITKINNNEKAVKIKKELEDIQNLTTEEKRDKKYKNNFYIEHFYQEIWKKTLNHAIYNAKNANLNAIKNDLEEDIKTFDNDNFQKKATFFQTKYNEIVKKAFNDTLGLKLENGEIKDFKWEDIDRGKFIQESKSIVALMQDEIKNKIQEDNSKFQGNPEEFADSLNSSDEYLRSFYINYIEKIAELSENLGLLASIIKITQAGENNFKDSQKKIFYTEYVEKPLKEIQKTLLSTEFKQETSETSIITTLENFCTKLKIKKEDIDNYKNLSNEGKIEELNTAIDDVITDTIPKEGYFNTEPPLSFTIIKNPLVQIKEKVEKLLNADPNSKFTIQFKRSLFTKNQKLLKKVPQMIQEYGIDIVDNAEKDNESTEDTAQSVYHNFESAAVEIEEEGKTIEVSFFKLINIKDEEGNIKPGCIDEDDKFNSMIATINAVLSRTDKRGSLFPPPEGTKFAKVSIDEKVTKFLELQNDFPSDEKGIEELFSKLKKITRQINEEPNAQLKLENHLRIHDFKVKIIEKYKYFEKLEKTIDNVEEEITKAIEKEIREEKKDEIEKKIREEKKDETEEEITKAIEEKIKKAIENTPHEKMKTKIIKKLKSIITNISSFQSRTLYHTKTTEYFKSKYNPLKEKCSKKIETKLKELKDMANKDKETWEKNTSYGKENLKENEKHLESWENLQELLEIFHDFQDQYLKKNNFYTKVATLKLQESEFKETLQKHKAEKIRKQDKINKIKELKKNIKNTNEKLEKLIKNKEAQEAAEKIAQIMGKPLSQQSQDPKKISINELEKSQYKRKVIEKREEIKELEKELANLTKEIKNKKEEDRLEEEKNLLSETPKLMMQMKKSKKSFQKEAKKRKWKKTSETEMSIESKQALNKIKSILDMNKKFLKDFKDTFDRTNMYEKQASEQVFNIISGKDSLRKATLDVKRTFKKNVYKKDIPHLVKNVNEFLENDISKKGLNKAEWFIDFSGELLNKKFEEKDLNSYLTLLKEENFYSEKYISFNPKKLELTKEFDTIYEDALQIASRFISLLAENNQKVLKKLKVFNDLKNKENKIIKDMLGFLKKHIPDYFDLLEPYAVYAKCYLSQATKDKPFKHYMISQDNIGILELREELEEYAQTVINNNNNIPEVDSIKKVFIRILKAKKATAEEIGKHLQNGIAIPYPCTPTFSYKNVFDVAYEQMLPKNSALLNDIMKDLGISIENTGQKIGTESFDAEIKNKTKYKKTHIKKTNNFPSTSYKRDFKNIKELEKEWFPPFVVPQAKSPVDDVIKSLKDFTNTLGDKQGLTKVLGELA